MNKREQKFLQMVKRMAAPLDVEFAKPPRGSYKVRVLRAREVLIQAESRSLDRLQYEFAAAIVKIKQAEMVREFAWRGRRSK